MTDTGDSPLQVIAVDPPSDPQFGVSPPASTSIQAGSSVALPCTFKPFGPGHKNATVLIHTDSQTIPIVTLNLQGVGVPVKLLVEPQVLDFQTVVIHSTIAKSITLTNQSDLSLTVTSSAISGNSASLFAYVPPSAPATAITLQPGGSQSIDVSFQPVIPSSLDVASFTLTPSIGPQVILSLRGVASETGLSVTPNPMDFGFVQPGQVFTQTMHIKNIGNQSINVPDVNLTNASGGIFAIPNGTVTSATPLAPSGELDIPVQFGPTGMGPYAGEIAVISNDNLSEIAVPLKGFGGGAAITCTPLALDFGIVAVGIGSTQPVICTNTGSDVPNHPEAGLLIGELPITTAAFDATLAPDAPKGYLPAGESAVLNVAYVPSISGSDNATLTVQSNVSNSPAPVVQLSGQGLVTAQCNYSITPSVLDWGVLPGIDKTLRYTQAFTIQNQGPATCVIAGVRLSQSNSGAFELQDGPITSQLLAPPGPPQMVDGGALPTSLTVPVSFAPKQGAGGYAGQVAFTISDPAAPNQLVNLIAQASDGCFFLHPNPLDLGTVGLTSNGQFCQARHKQFVAVNNCEQDVSISSANFAGGTPFDEVDGPALPVVVAGGSSSPPFVVGFTPNAVGDYYGALTLQTDLLAQPFGLTLHGKATPGTQQTDTFQGASGNAVDILWVIDTDDLGTELTCCGAPPGLLDKLSEFVASVGAGVDYQMAVLGDDCPARDNGNLEPCPTCYNQGDSPTFITPQTPDPGATLKSMITAISQGTGGFDCPAYEAPMVAAWEALQPNILAGHNMGFLRDGAALAVIAYDPDGNLEDEGSSQTVDFYVNFFSSLKGGSTNLITVSLMYADVFEGGTKTPPGPRYTSLAKTSDGLLIDTAGQNWTQQISQLWSNLLGGSAGFPLSGTPTMGTITVWLDGPPPGPGVSAPGIQIQPGNPNGTWNWEYLPTSNSIVLNSANFSLLDSDTLTVAYSLACN